MIKDWWGRVDKVGLGVLLGALAIFLPMSGSYGMWDPWETHYGEAARQILVRGDWWTLYWEDNFFFSKPILLFWLMAMSFSLFGVSEFAARLPVILCAVMGIVSVYWGVRSVTSSKRAGVLAAAAVSSIPLYAFIARQAITDMPFVASMTVAMMALARYEFAPGGRPRHMYMVYFFCGLATLAKGPLGLLLPGAVVLGYLIVSGNWGLLKRAKIPAGLAIFLTVAAPWYAAMLLMHGERFYNEFIVYNNVQRATGSGVHGSHIDFLYYLRSATGGRGDGGAPVLQAGTFPWLSLFPAAAFTYLARRVSSLFGRGGAGDDAGARGRLQLALLLLSWALVAFVVFSSIPTKFHHYLLPLAPPVAAVAALWLFDAAEGRIGRLVAAVGLLVGGGITLWLARLLGSAPGEVLDLFMYQYGRWQSLDWFVNPGAPPVTVGDVYRYSGYAIAAVMVVAAVVGRYRLKLAAVAAALSIGLTIYGIDVYLPRASDCVSQADAFRHYRSQRRPGDRLVNWQMNYRGEVFYGHSAAVKSVSDAHLQWLLSRAERSFIVANRHVFGSLAQLMRRITRQEPQILNPATCNTRMLLYDGPRVSPPRFSPQGVVVEAVPDSVVHRLEGVRLGPDIGLVGYQVDWIGAGSNLTADVTLYLRCEQETEEWWKVFIHGESSRLPGRRAISDHIAGGDSYPSAAWHPGEIIVDRTRLRVGNIWSALDGQGELTINVGLFHDETRTRISPESAHDGEDRIVVARYSASETPEDALLSELPAEVTPLETPIRFGDYATLLAFDVQRRGQGRQATAEVVLYLRAERRTDEPYQIFLHAQGEGGRRDREVSDHHPASGRLPTTRWEPGQIVRDRTVLDLSRLSRQRVRVFGGMFGERQRAEVAPSSADAGERRVLLGELTP